MKIIDFHTHTFPDAIAEKTIAHLSKKSRTKPFLSAKAGDLSADNIRCGISLSVILPVVTTPEKANKINDASALINQTTTKTGLFSFGGVHPDTPNIKEEIKRIASLGLKGIKIHPAYQQVPLNDIRNKKIVEYAEENGLIVLVHGGLDIGVEGDWSNPKQCLEVLNDVQPTRLVMAHLGAWNQWKDVENYLCGRNVYLDTAFCYGDYEYDVDWPNEKKARPLESEQLCRLIRSHGTNKVLFGTDSPWAERKTQVELFSLLPLTQEEKEQIFHLNAEKLLLL